MRKFFGCVAGMAAAMLIIFLIELIGSSLFPVDIDVQSADAATMARIIAEMPLAAKLFVVVGWALGSFGGAWLALRISDWRWSGWIVVALVLAGGIATLLALPHPLWMQVCAVLLPLLSGWLAQRLHHKPYAGEPLLG